MRLVLVSSKFCLKNCKYLFPIKLKVSFGELLWFHESWWSDKLSWTRKKLQQSVTSFLFLPFFPSSLQILLLHLKPFLLDLFISEAANQRHCGTPRGKNLLFEEGESRIYIINYYGAPYEWCFFLLLECIKANLSIGCYSLEGMVVAEQCQYLT